MGLFMVSFRRANGLRCVAALPSLSVRQPATRQLHAMLDRVIAMRHTTDHKPT